MFVKCLPCFAALYVKLLQISSFSVAQAGEIFNETIYNFSDCILNIYVASLYI